MTESSQRVVFAGTPEFAVPSLQMLVNGPETVVGVFTQPDRPAGRGRQLTPSPVKRAAQEHGIPVFQPLTFKDPLAHAELRELRPDLLVVVAYGMLLPPAALAIPRLGAINVHASLLPAFRGAAPIQRVIEQGEPETGISIMQMEESLDSGPVLLTRRIPVAADETGGTLHDKLMHLGAEALREALDKLWAGRLQGVPQDNERATYAPKLKKAEGNIDWDLPAVDLERMIRAFNPYPVAQTVFRGKILRIWRARAESPSRFGDGPPGMILGVEPETVWVATSSGALGVEWVQWPGKPVMTGRDFVHGYRPQINERFGT